MKYTKEEREDIGRQIYEGKLTTAMAATQYDIDIYTARDYLRLYKASINVAIPKEFRKRGQNAQDKTLKSGHEYEDYEQMSREELLDELIKARIEAERAKKGYEVKGDGQEKEFVPINSKNTKS